MSDPYILVLEDDTVCLKFIVSVRVKSQEKNALSVSDSLHDAVCRAIIPSVLVSFDDILMLCGNISLFR